MKIAKRVLAEVASLLLVFSMASPFAALAQVQPAAMAAATAPSLGAASTFSALAALSMSSTASNTVLSGDLGLSPGLAVSRTGTWTVGGTEYFGTGGVSQQAQTDALAAYTNLSLQTSDGVWASASPAPGVYTIALDTTFAGPTLTLNGNYDDVWVFQIGQDLTFSGSVVMAGNAQPCNVFWQVGRDVTIASGASFAGTLIASRDISFASGATVDGRVISLNSSLVMSGTSSSITGPTCVAAPVSSGPTTGRVTVIKTVINDSGRTNTVSDFSLFLNGSPVDSGETLELVPTGEAYTVTETPNANYTQTFSGDCDSDGRLNLNPGDYRVCVVTNDDIGAAPVVPPVPPIIAVLKVPSPLSLPNGPGQVTYTYTIRNIGTVPMTNITMVGDTCTPIVRVSGDVNNNSILEVSETWVFTCTTTLSQTHTNTVVATGWANGLSSSDVASATVVVSQPIVPPLIHVTKVPSPLTLVAGGGMVTYTERITNPGTVPLSNVTLTDDKCGPMKFVSGDTDGDSMLDSTETWTYTCSTNLTKTTTNTATARGSANGLTVVDFAIATVVVSTVVPALPATGVAPAATLLTWLAVAAALFAVSMFVYAIRKSRVS